MPYQEAWADFFGLLIAQCVLYRFAHDGSSTTLVNRNDHIHSKCLDALLRSLGVSSYVLRPFLPTIGLNINSLLFPDFLLHWHQICAYKKTQHQHLRTV